MPNKFLEKDNLKNRKTGFTLVETLVGVFVFSVIALAIYQGFFAVTDLVKASRARTAATLLANQQLEIIRNMPYAQVGEVGGIPSGLIQSVQSVTDAGITFISTTTVRNVDDTFDGTIGGAPNDLSPADYKLVQLDMNCSVCKLAQPLAFVATVAPKSLETSSGNGALFVRVLDANGQPVAGANVHIANNLINPAISIDDVTNNAGMLQLVDVPPGNFAYEITVSKSDYSTDRTYPAGAVGNPNPVNPHSTVSVGQVTQVTLSIDRTSQINFSGINSACVSTPSAGFNLQGNKLLGTSPNVLKYNQNHTLDGAGHKTIANLEWDTYSLSITDAGTDLAGSVPLLPFSLAPNTDQNVLLVTAPANPNALLVTVKDAASLLPIDDASVTLSRGGFSENRLTNRGFFRQTDWSGGAGQVDFVSANQYFSDDGNVDTAGVLGQAQLRSVFGNYVASGVLTSSIFDTGSSTASAFYNINWTPASQSASTTLRFQIATGNDNATSTWDYLGPDGTSNTFYTVSGEPINAVHNSDEFIRYRAYFSTIDPNFTPVLSDVSIVYGSGCLPSGQVFFNNLTSASDYNLNVTATGYQNYQNNSVSATQSWQTFEVLMSP